MRILHLSTRLILGGSQENTVLSCEGQARLGHEVHLAFGPIYGPEGSLLARVEGFRAEDGRGITTHVVPRLVRAVHPVKDLLAHREVGALVRRLEPDVVHTHSSKAGIVGRSAAWGARWGGGRKAAVVHTVHGSPFHAYQNRWAHGVYVASERWAARRCDVIVSVADAMTRQYLAAGIGRPALYTTVRSGMDLAPFGVVAPGESRAEVRGALGLAEGDFVVGTVARLAELKGHDDLLDALGEDLKANSSWRLLWVGDGWWRERLLARVRGMGLEGRVVTTGLVVPERVPGMLRAMDVLAHPSYREGLPRTVPQALLAGVVPVAYDVDGTGEVCVEMETGRLLRAGDVAGLRGAVAWCAANPGACRVMASRGRAECEREFGAGAMVRGLEEVYARAVALAAAR